MRAQRAPSPRMGLGRLGRLTANRARSSTSPPPQPARQLERKPQRSRHNHKDPDSPFMDRQPVRNIFPGAAPIGGYSRLAHACAAGSDGESAGMAPRPGQLLVSWQLRCQFPHDVSEQANPGLLVLRDAIDGCAHHVLGSRLEGGPVGGVPHRVADQRPQAQPALSGAWSSTVRASARRCCLV